MDQIAEECGLQVSQGLVSRGQNEKIRTSSTCWSWRRQETGDILHCQGLLLFRKSLTILTDIKPKALLSITYCKQKSPIV